MKKCVALIPARSGSVRIRHKNLIQIQGVPLLAIAVQQARMLPEIDEVYISTDSEIYAEIAANYGAVVPFIRPPEISQPDSTDYEVFAHFLNWYVTEKRETPDLLIQIRATAPMRDLKFIQKAIKLMLFLYGDCLIPRKRSCLVQPICLQKIMLLCLNDVIMPRTEP